MTDNHPITPPPELVEQWVYGDDDNIRTSPNWYKVFAAKAARWGADQELEACGAYLERCAQWEPEDIDDLRAARRPKPPSRKEQALEAVSRLCASVIHDDLKNDAAIVRRALSELPND